MMKIKLELFINLVLNFKRSLEQKDLLKLNLLLMFQILKMKY